MSGLTSPVLSLSIRPVTMLITSALPVKSSGPTKPTNEMGVVCARQGPCVPGGGSGLKSVQKKLGWFCPHLSGALGNEYNNSPEPALGSGARCSTGVIVAKLSLLSPAASYQTPGPRNGGKPCDRASTVGAVRPVADEHSLAY